MRRSHKLLAAALVSLNLGIAGALAGTCTASARASSAATTSTTATTMTTSSGDPTASQVTAAIRAATGSRQLWATINRCDENGGGKIGIRGEMPSLPFPAHLLMVVKLDEYSPTALRYVPVTGAWKLGGKVFAGGALVQEGISLRFAPGVTLIGHVTFEWFRDGRLLGKTTRITTAGHDEDSGTPRGTSDGTCSLM